jgi:hypothetical protein
LYDAACNASDELAVVLFFSHVDCYFGTCFALNLKAQVYAALLRLLLASVSHAVLLQLQLMVDVIAVVL